MLQSRQESAVTRLAHGGDHPANMFLNNNVTLLGYGLLTDVPADLVYDGNEDIFDECDEMGDAAEIAENLLKSKDPQVVALNSECYYHNETYQRFFSVLEQATSSPPPFVLVFAGFDSPLNRTTQDRIRKLRALKACYATNLQDPIDDKFFFPMPIGVGGNIADEKEVNPVPWEKKTGKVLLPAMETNIAARAQYVSTLNRSEFAHLVDIWPSDKRVSLGEYLQVLAGYKAVVSPTGNGYDCCRHWECLAVGTVPLVMKDDAFDMRLFNGTGAAFIPPADELTPDVLSQLLGSLQDPSPFNDVLDIRLWERKWRSHLS